MAVKTAEIEPELLDSVCQRVREELPKREAEHCAEFVRQYYHWVPPDDLAGRGAEDLYGAAAAHWSLAQDREPGEMKLKVYNPDSGRDGWRSRHTVVEIVGDDMPFIVDSVTMELSREGFGIHLVIHPVIHVKRDSNGHLEGVVQDGSDRGEGTTAESVLHVEVDCETDADELEHLRENLERVLEDVRAAVEDWQAMRARAAAIADELQSKPAGIDADEAERGCQYLRWLVEDNFTFLGYREYELVDDDGHTGLRQVDGSGLGVLRKPRQTRTKKLPPTVAEMARRTNLLVLTKANSRATVHRPSYLDYVGVKTFNEQGEVTGERRFLGLYSTAAYRASAREVPLLREKVKAVLERAGFAPDSHDAKALIEILEIYPREQLFQIGIDELFTVAMGILGLGERQRVRLFARRDPLERFVSCLVFIPRDRFNTESRHRIGRILTDAFSGGELDWSILLSESVLVRIHYVVHCDSPPPEVDIAQLERRLVAAARAWSDDLADALVDQLGEERGTDLFKAYRDAFPPGYQADWPAHAAVADIVRLEELTESDGLLMDLYRPEEAPERTLRCKLFSAQGVLLSDVLPTFEDMGAKVVDERPYEITARGGDGVFIYDFGLRCAADDAEPLRNIFEEVFLGVWRGTYEDDRLNALVLHAGLDGRQITVLRAVVKYLRQGGIAFSNSYMQSTLIDHASIASLIVDLFCAKFAVDGRDNQEAERLVEEIEGKIDVVESLDEDRILRSFLSVVQAMVRTNYFRTEEPGPAAGLSTSPRPFLSFKLDPSEIPILPLPRPRFEIFVYSPRTEGVHLRGGKVARGGLRWSDRKEDFRTEVLGLMKAQMVKNALIVPVGSKGGFVVKKPPADGGREALQEEVTSCYKVFISGLLDLTDNIVEGRVEPPPQVVRYDEDDPYLVVAADKGTATFSDIANGISSDYGFWLGDAFASGGSHGYDHKQMGITARGAWESVKRHFRELGLDVQSTDFTVVGIGDMSGDVFGNGMLLSEHIKLVGAFNHQHIFLDPDPDSQKSFEERKRLFEMPRSSWEDYDESLISKGGGVYSRNAKSIEISDQARAALGIEEAELAPADLIKALLESPVDLLWNGGIGTYVKAQSESNADVGDKTNDSLRVNGAELRCRVVGEGGNLGFTQNGRIEYALGGGRINTDAIDNVAGVNCSDHEVNIKILLNAVVDDGELSEDERNDLLVEMTDAVGKQVLYGSYTQTQALSIALAQAASMVDVHARMMRRLEQVAELNRELEDLPSDETITDRKHQNGGFLSPEVAVLMAYSKILLYSMLLDSDLPEDPYLGHDLERYFPAPLPERYARQMQEHRLRREIIATVVANQLVDRAGTTFTFRLWEETGAPASDLARAYAVSRELFQMRDFWQAVEGLDNQIDAQVQLEMLIEGRRLVERSTRWLIRNKPPSIDIEEAIERFASGAERVAGALPDVLEGDDRVAFEQQRHDLEESGVPRELAVRVASMAALFSTLDIVEVAAATGRSLEAVTGMYFRLGSRLELNWLRDRIVELPRANRWQALARAALRDDLYHLHRELSLDVLRDREDGGSSDEEIDTWAERNAAAVERALGVVQDIKASDSYDTTTLPVALREVRNLVGDRDQDGRPPKPGG